MDHEYLNRVLFISPRKTTPLSAEGLPVQKTRINVSLPALTILGSLEQAGFETRFLDLAAEGWLNRQKMGPRLLAYGLTTDHVLDAITDFKPDFVLVTSMFTSECMMVDEIVAAVRTTFPGIRIVVGGIHASYKPDWHFGASDPDVVVIGEGEETVVDLLTEMRQPQPDIGRIRGIMYRDATGRLQRTEPRPFLTRLDRYWALDTVLRTPDGQDRYRDSRCCKSPVYVDDSLTENISTFSLYASRGCPVACAYCTAASHSGKSIRHMGFEHAYHLFHEARTRFGVSVFCNQSDAYAIHRADIELLRAIASYRATSGDRRFILNNPNAFYLESFFTWTNGNPCLRIEFLELLRKAGFNTVTVAVETLSQRFNSKVDWSKLHPDNVLDLACELRRREFKVDIYMMYGFPGQDTGEFMRDIQFAERLLGYSDSVTWNWLTLLPGTEYYRCAIELAGREDEYRRAVHDGYGFFAGDRFNLSKVAAAVFRDRIAQFGQQWV